MPWAWEPRLRLKEGGTAIRSDNHRECQCGRLSLTGTADDCRSGYYGGCRSHHMKGGFAVARAATATVGAYCVIRLPVRFLHVLHTCG